MRYEVKLVLHQDDAIGSWGLCHDNAIGQFNAFWSPDGIFHDVFEHWMEDNHKYFKHDAAFTIWGEIVASGQAIAYRNIGIDNFRYRASFNSRNRDFTADTHTIFEVWAYNVKDDESYLNSGSEFSLDCCMIPRQIDPDNQSLNHWIYEYEAKIEEMKEMFLLLAQLLPQRKSIGTVCLKRNSG